MQKFIGTKIIHAEPRTKDYGPTEQQGQAGYTVVYPDGYTSWSPAAAFEEAYRLCDGMPFGLAVEAMKKGLKVARTGWNGVQPKTGFIPPTRDPVIYEGLCYILLATGDVAYCDAEDFDLISHQRNWTLMGNDYPAYTDNGARKTVKLHQLLLTDHELVDHENGNKLDNRRRNLRPCSSAENTANSASREGSSSRFKGVTWDKSRDKWMAAIAAHGKSKTLGRFDSEEDAAHAYDAAARDAYGQFARLNFPMPIGMFAYYVPAASYPAQTGAARSHFGEDAMVPYRAYMALKTADGSVATWAPSGSDALADDWMIVE